MISQKLDVFLRGDRNYVQGSQVLARSLDLLEAALPAGSVAWSLNSAKFEYITRGAVYAVEGQVDAPLSKKIGVATFSRKNQRIKLTYVTDESSPVVHRADKVSPILNFTILSGTGALLACRGSVLFDGSAESILEGIIAIVKRLHQSRGPGISDVWFTALKNASIAAHCDRICEEVFIDVEQRVSRLVGDRFQTLSVVTVRSTSEIVIPEFQISFSYKADHED